LNLFASALLDVALCGNGRYVRPQRHQACHKTKLQYEQALLCARNASTVVWKTAARMSFLMKV
jgi:hypothetical protein